MPLRDDLAGLLVDRCDEAISNGNANGGAVEAPGVEMIEGFGGAVFDEAASSYTFPAGSEDWAGFANLNTDIYPFTFANAGSITFTAAIAAGAGGEEAMPDERPPHY